MFRASLSALNIDKDTEVCIRPRYHICDIQREIQGTWSFFNILGETCRYSKFAKSIVATAVTIPAKNLGRKSDKYYNPEHLAVYFSKV